MTVGNGYGSWLVGLGSSGFVAVRVGVLVAVGVCPGGPGVAVRNSVAVGKLPAGGVGVFVGFACSVRLASTVCVIPTASVS